jgi:hypothetical protein
MKAQCWDISSKHEESLVDLSIASFIFYIISKPKKRDIIRVRRNLPKFPSLNCIRPVLHLLRSLLLQIRLNTPLPRLSIIMLPLRLSLLRIIASQTRDRTTDSASDTVWKALAQVIQLSSSLLFLALLVLTSAVLLEARGANKTADSFLCGTDVLVPW